MMINVLYLSIERGQSLCGKRLQADIFGAAANDVEVMPVHFTVRLHELSDLQDMLEILGADHRVNVNTVICAENFEHILGIAQFVKAHCEVDGHYFNIIRGSAKDVSLKSFPAERLPALYRQIQDIYHHYAPTILKRLEGIERLIGEAYYEGTMAFHNKVQLQNIDSPHPWPMPCTAGETTLVIDYNGDVRACELRDQLANV